MAAFTTGISPIRWAHERTQRIIWGTGELVHGEREFFQPAARLQSGHIYSHPNCDIFLDDITVSRQHAQFRCVNAEFRVIDVGSLTGTYVNREPVDSAVLANGDELQIGKSRLMFLSGPTTDGTDSEGS